MLEVLTGSGLAVAAGLNAYIPLLVLGIAGQTLDFVALPAAWAWLENPWVIAILIVLLIIEVVADKVPMVDSINDWIQTLVRPAAGGIAFGTGAASETAVVTDPASFFSSNAWVPVAIGIVLALGTHATKMAARPVLNAATAGVAAPVVSTLEDVSSVVLSLLALIVPVLGTIALVALVALLFVRVRRARRAQHLRQ
ncbi:DUF4126 domain-containing protein [Salinibacterium sp. UTAS2018]|uniref:DUF4126 domain-containing protein n=1 Tax=Salinibacterium sp. UTAS2018 TaxID=2508880 RepID=UPI001009788D|nr:DUF4126 domain-containing protein [Salinibacterium sp. UTAS2018]QAV69458.1 DUF4126 domain-containing protein [Salinibacterium sp. UTAS2018]